MSLKREWEDDPRWQELERKAPQCSFPLCPNERAGALLSCMEHHEAWMLQRDEHGNDWPHFCLAAYSTLTECAECQVTFFAEDPDYLCPLCRGGQGRLFSE